MHDGSESNSSLELTPSISETIDKLKDPSEAKKFTQEKILDFGKELWEALFREDIKTQFENAMKKVDAQHGLRILLKTAPKESAYPWEAMSYKDIPLSTDIRTPIVRIFEGDNNARNIKEKLPKILLILSNASGQYYVDTAVERDIIVGSLESNQNVARPPEIVDVATIDNIQEKISSMEQKGEPVNIIHFVGHGKFEDETGFLALKKSGPVGDVEEAKEDVVRHLFLNQVNSLGLIVLNACSTAAISSEFTGLVPKLLSRVPAVVAMRQPISDIGAKSFARGFYQNLYVESIEASMQNARNNMFINNNCRGVDFTIPVLYLSWQDLNGTVQKIFVKELPIAPKPSVVMEIRRKKKPSEFILTLMEISGDQFTKLEQTMKTILNPSKGDPGLKFWARNKNLWTYLIENFRKKCEELALDLSCVYSNAQQSISPKCVSLFDKLDNLADSIEQELKEDAEKAWNEVKNNYEELNGAVSKIIVGELEEHL
jgi:hypothetical protein